MNKKDIKLIKGLLKEKIRGWKSIMGLRTYKYLIKGKREKLEREGFTESYLDFYERQIDYYFELKRFLKKLTNNE